MLDQLEADLSEAFAHRASSVPADAGARMRAVDFHPRTGRMSPRLKVGSLAGIAAASGTVASVVLLGGTQPAFAGWTAQPAVDTAAPAPGAAAACQAQLSDQSVPGEPTGGTWTPIATDVRGPYTVVIYENGSLSATCFNGPSFTVVNTHGSSDGGTSHFQAGSVRATPSADGGGPTNVTGRAFIGSGSDAITFMSDFQLDLDAASGGPYTLVEGQTAPDVTGVSLVRSDGSDVVATTVGGNFVAWWPGTLDVTSAEITTPSGQSTQTIAPHPIGNGAPPVPVNCPNTTRSGSGSGPKTDSPSDSSTTPNVVCRNGTSGGGDIAP